LGKGVGVMWSRWMVYYPHNIKTFIEAEEWEVVKTFRPYY